MRNLGENWYVEKSSRAGGNAEKHIKRERFTLKHEEVNMTEVKKLCPKCDAEMQKRLLHKWGVSGVVDFWC